MIIVKTASNAGAIFNPVAFESMNIAAELVTANFATVDSGDTPTRDSIALTCTATKEHAVANDFLQLIRSERTVTLDGPNLDFAGISDVSAIAASLDGTPVVNEQKVINVSTATRTLLDSESGSLVVIDANGCAITMPQCDAAAVGQFFDFVVGTSQTSSNVITITLNAADDYKGCLTLSKADGSTVQFHSDGTDTVITLNATTKGGLEGGRIRLYYGEVAKVYATGSILGSGTLANSFS